MKKRQNRKTKTSTPATGADKVLELQRKRSARVLLKRRRAKSGQ